MAAPIVLSALASALGTLLLFYGPQEAQYWLTKENKAAYNKKMLELSSKIATDTTLANQIIDNVNNRKMDIASSLINASPFSSAYSKVMKEVKNLDKQKDEAQEKLKSIDKDTREYNQVASKLTSEAEKTFTGAIADKVKETIPAIKKKGENFFGNIKETGMNITDKIRNKFKEVF